MNTETAALRAIETAVSSEQPVDRAPEFDAAIQFANLIGNLTNERDGLRHETGLQRHRITSLEHEKEQITAEFESRFAQYRSGAEAEIARLRDQIEEAMDHANFFMRDSDQLRDAMNSCERIIERSKGIDRTGFADRSLHRKAVGDMPATAEPFGAPKPQFLTGSPQKGANITPITRLKPVSLSG